MQIAASAQQADAPLLLKKKQRRHVPENKGFGQKGPSRTKNSTESKFTTGREKNATAIAKRCGECSEMLVFQAKEAGKRYGQ